LKEIPNEMRSIVAMLVGKLYGRRQLHTVTGDKFLNHGDSEFQTNVLQILEVTSSLGGRTIHSSSRGDDPWSYEAKYKKSKR
jgi:hypothetical protein